MLDPHAASGTLAGAGGEAVTVLIGGAELLLAAWLFAGGRPVLSLVVTAGVYLLFTGVLAAELAAETPRPCGCFGGAAPTDPAAVRRGLWLGLLRNLALAAAALTGLALAPRPPHAADATRHPAFVPIAGPLAGGHRLG